MALIVSESHYKDGVTHAEKNVVGQCGINTKVHKDLPYNPFTKKGNIMDCGFLLAKNYKKHRTWFKAVKAYKGWSSLGERQARLVLNNIKG